MIKFFIKLFKSLFEDRDGYVSRKLAAAWVLSFMTSLQLFIHIPITIWFDVEIGQILTGSDFIQFLSIIWGTYFASDVAGSWIYEKGKIITVESNEKTE
jgi:hypothetical protein